MGEPNPICLVQKWPILTRYPTECQNLVGVRTNEYRNLRRIKEATKITLKNRMLPSFFIPTKSSVSCPATTAADKEIKSMFVEEFISRQKKLQETNS